jgi:hypothetical protein
MGWKFRHNTLNVADILEHQAEPAIRAITQQIAAGASAELHGEAEVDAIVITTDRAHGIVAIKSPAGLAIEGRRGVLTRAASSAGLTVKRRRG